MTKANRLATVGAARARIRPRAKTSHPPAMKAKISAGLIAAIASVTAAEPSLEFPQQKIGIPPLSLAEVGKASAGPVPFESQSGSILPPRIISIPRSRGTLTWSMPIVVPREDIDPAFVKEPDSATDYKIRVIPPMVESTR